jgi:hypothetical protein
VTACIDETPTPQISAVWSKRHDDAAALAERLTAWIEAQRERMDPITRRSVHSTEQQRAAYAERLCTNAISVAWSIAGWVKTQPTMEEAHRTLQILDEITAAGERLMAGLSQSVARPPIP